MGNNNIHQVHQTVKSNNLQNITECSDEEKDFSEAVNTQAIISAENNNMATPPVSKTETQLNTRSSSEHIPKNIQKHNSIISQEWVNLNVGGTILTTTKTTLLKYSDINDHFLAKLISDKNDLPSTTDNNGAFLVDRNPDYF